MALPSDSDTVAFGRPGGEQARTVGLRPIDMMHLSRQTMGDRGLEQEVLLLFMQQATLVRDQIGRATVDERLRLAHGLKGSARGVGAFVLADCLQELERRPDDKAVHRRLAGLIDDVRSFIAAIYR